MSVIRYILLGIIVLASGFLIIIQFSMTGISDLKLAIFLALLVALYSILLLVASKSKRTLIVGLLVVISAFLLGFLPYDSFVPHSYQTIFDATYRDENLSNLALKFPFPVSVIVEVLFFFFLHLFLLVLFSRLIKKT